MRYIIIIMISLLSVLFSLWAEQEPQKYPHGDINIECSVCHSTRSWEVLPDSMKFSHDRTGFSLQGRHQSISCRECHQNLIFAHIGISCIDCHLDVHKAELGSNCQNCHTPVNWNNVQDIFETHSETRFPLVGVHAIVDCEACHFNREPSEYKNTPLECFGCHQDDYASSENPDHAEVQFSNDCESCHSLAAASWYQSFYQHPPAFVLRASHLGLDCNSCHSAGYISTPNRCEDCHMDDYRDAEDPDHPKFGFPTVCETCHNENNWQDAIFDHTEASGFELKGIHLTISCLGCHVNNQITGLPRDCMGCHTEDYNAVQDPNHQTGRFPENCLECHTETSWTPATFDHAQTNFPLTGAHMSVACGNCHINGQYTGLGADCWSCHEADYLAVTDPNHNQAKFSRDCLECHTDNAWKPATFDHAQTNFPLTGAHLTVLCSDCHTDGQYTGLPTDCYACHKSAYDGTNDPNHSTAGFPVQCENCHNTVSWDQTTWDHDSQYFPIKSGAHQQAWNSCSDCHNIPSDYKKFECILCHEHNKTDMDNKHREEQGYTYQSNACFDCHPTGRSDGD